MMAVKVVEMAGYLDLRIMEGFMGVMVCAASAAGLIAVRFCWGGG